MRFREEFNLIILNTILKKKKKEGKLWTWMSLNKIFRAQLDYIITSKNLNYVADC